MYVGLRSLPACRQWEVGGSESITIHQLPQRSELIMLSHMSTLSLTASLLFGLLKFSGLGPLLSIEWIVD